MLQKQVSAAEHLYDDWLTYESECEKAEKLMSELECELDDVSCDTDPQHLHSRYQRLQVSTHDSHVDCLSWR